MQTISTDLAYRLRWERDLQLPTDHEYSDPRVAELAKRMKAAYDELESIDLELARLFNAQAAF